MFSKVKLYIQTIDWKTNLQNFLVFAGADTIVALVAIQTQLIPLIHSTTGVMVAVIVTNWIIDLYRKFLDAHKSLN